MHLLSSQSFQAATSPLQHQKKRGEASQVATKFPPPYPYSVTCNIFVFPPIIKPRLEIAESTEAVCVLCHFARKTTYPFIVLVEASWRVAPPFILFCQSFLRVIYCSGKVLDHLESAIKLSRSSVEKNGIGFAKVAAQQEESRRLSFPKA